MPTFWADAEINWMINESLRVWNVVTGYFKDSQSVTLTFGASNFYSPASFSGEGTIILRIETGVTHLDSITLKELNLLSPTWLGLVGTSPSYWFHIGLNVVALQPNATGTTPITTYYIDTAPIPSSDGSYIQVGEEDMNAIIEYVGFIASIKEGGQELKDATSSLKFFLDAASKYNARVLQTSLYKRILGLPRQQQSRPETLMNMPAR